MTEERDAGGLDAFLDAVAAKQPTPGGGGVAAACGALGCALARMVAAYSPGKDAEVEAAERVRSLLGQIERLDHALRSLVQEDARAYAALSTASKRVKADPSAQADYETALGVAIAVPMEIAAVAAEALQGMEQLRPLASRYLVSDLGVAATLVDAAVRAASYMVRVNVASLPDGENKRKSAEAIERLVLKSRQALTRIESALPNRV